MSKHTYWGLGVILAITGPMILTPGSAYSEKSKSDGSLSQRIANASKVDEKDVLKVLRALGPAVKEDLLRGRSVDLPGLGSLRVVQVQSHRDLVNGVPLRLPSSNNVEFLPNSDLVEAANAADVKPAVSVAPFEYVPIPGQTPSQRTDYIRTPRRR